MKEIGGTPAVNRIVFGYYLPIIYVLIALPVVVANAFILAPFQAADETTHFFRINQISHGEIVGHKDKIGSAGGDIDKSLIDIFPFFDDVNSRHLPVSPQSMQ